MSNIKLTGRRIISEIHTNDQIFLGELINQTGFSSPRGLNNGRIVGILMEASLMTWLVESFDMNR